MKIKLLYIQILKFVTNKNFILFFALLFFSVSTFGQNHNEVIKTYLSNNTEKFDLTTSDIQEWKITNEVFSKQSKVTHIYIQQLYKGIPVFNAVSNISIKDNIVIHAGNNFIKDISSKISSSIPVINAKTAIIQTASQLKLGNVKNLQLLEEKSSLNFVFSKSGISHEKIPVELVYQPLEDGSVKLAWKLNVHQLDGLHWWNVRIDANTGRLLQKNDWGVNCNFDINTGKHSHVQNKNRFNFKKESIALTGEKYNVFGLPIESPNHGSRLTITNPQNTTASPFGWHDTDGVTGAEFTITRGNNVYAQLDDDGSNGTSGYSPDGGSELDFNFSLDLVDKSPDSYKDASLTNLFYMSNVMHDIWYQYGFDEVSGNFQTNNYGKGGTEGDEVVADGQDASGRNNANFATPSDGQNPRMQMFIWDDDSLLNINSGSLVGKYPGRDSSFTDDGTPDGNSTGVALRETPYTADLALMNDGSANPLEACSLGLVPGMTGKIAVIKRGNCNFTNKVMLAQQNGAFAVIMVNNEAGVFGMAGATTTINIPAISVTQEVGDPIIAALQNGETINVTLVNYGLDGSFDNGIIAHEYGHGISNRLIGGPSNANCMQNSEQLGEGWSDYFGIAITMKPNHTETTLRGVGTFAAGQSITGSGIRQYPYTTDMTVNPFTLDDVKDQALADGGVSVHGVGSIWATMLWDLHWKMIGVYGFDADMYNGTGGNNKTMQLIIEGLKLTPCSSGFIGARDAILAADDALNGGVNKCIIWEVFARRGLGYSASSGSTDSFTDQVEAFDMPPAAVLAGSSCALSVNDEELKIFTIYPNPASTSINISISKEVINATISIYNINGRKVYDKKADLKGNHFIDTKNLSPGIYVLKINNRTINYSKKVIIN